MISSAFHGWLDHRTRQLWRVSWLAASVAIGGCGNSGSSTIGPVTPNPSPSGVVIPAPFTRLTIEESQAPWGKNLGDLDGDGQLDIVEGGGGQGSNVYWYQYPNWNKYLIGSVGGDDDLQIADINRDGAPDVIVNGGIAWYENPRGSGGNPHDQWVHHVIDAVNAHDLLIADIDGDGWPDAVTRAEFGGTTLYLNNIGGTRPGATWIKVTIGAAENGIGSALADINRDGRIDIVQNGYWLQQPIDPTVGANWIRRNFTAWPNGSSVAVGDLNGDGRLDVVLAYAEAGVGDLAWFEGPADPVATTSWTKHTLGTAEDVHRMHVADFNRDGKLDVLYAEMHQSATERIAIYYNHGGGAQWTHNVLAMTGGHNIAIGDVGNDGDIDILVANWDTNSPDGGRLSLWRNDLGRELVLNNWSYVQVDNSKLEPSFGLHFADMDRDGHRDIIAGRYWYRNPGGDMTGSWSRTDLGANRDAMAVLDVDGDARMDVIVEGLPSGGNVPVIWLRPTGNSATSFEATTIGSIPEDPGDGRSQGYAIANVRGNEKPEIFLSSVGIHYFEIPSNPGAGNWPRVQVTSEAREEGIAVGDIDGDGDTDVVALVAPAGTTVAWWENPGDGSGNWIRHDLGNTGSIEGDRVALGDINGDGRLDVIVTQTNLDAGGNSLFWYAQPANPTANNWTRTTVASDLGSLNSMDVADVNGDGRPDIVTGEHRGSLRVTVWKNNGNGTFTGNIVATGIESHLGARVDDLDGDGDLDIVSIAWDSFSYVHLWRNNAQ